MATAQHLPGAAAMNPVVAFRWIAKDFRGGDGERVVLSNLLAYCDRHGECWPSVARIARETEKSERSVRRILKALRKKGLIHRSTRRKSDGRQTSNLYSLRVPPEARRGDTGDTRRGDTGDMLWGDTGDTQRYPRMKVPSFKGANDGTGARKFPKAEPLRASSSEDRARERPGVESV